MPYTSYGRADWPHGELWAKTWNRVCVRPPPPSHAAVIIGKLAFEFSLRAAGSFLVGLTLLIAGCSRPGSTAGSSALKPIDQAALQTMVDTTARELLIPGAVVLLRTPQGEFTVTYGTTQLGATTPPRADTHFRIASNTKTMTAAVILQLAQEGKLSLDDPVSKYVPGVPNGDNITIAELLKMRSGLYNYDDDPEFWAILDRDPTKVWTPAEVLAIAFKHPPNFPPGTGFEYTNTNYALLGLIAEKVDGKPLASCLQDRLFGPLGLKDTLLPASTSNTIPEPYSHGYLYGGCSFSNLVDKPLPARPPSRGPGRNPQARRLHRPEPFLRLGGRGRHLDRQRSRHLDPGTGRRQGAQRRLSAPVARQPAARGSEQARGPTSTGTASPNCSWGPNTIYFHGGEMPGFNSFIGYDPANKMTLVVWTNLTVSLDGQPTANALMLKVLDQIYVVSPLPPPPSPVTSAKPVGHGAPSQP